MNENDLLNFIRKPIERYETMFHCKTQVDISLLDECFCRVNVSLRKQFQLFQAPEGYLLSPFKMAGVICFWIRKLKPIRALNNVAENSVVNEVVAFLVGYHLVYKFSKNKNLRHPKINSVYFHDLIVSLRYNSWSPTSLSFLFEALCL